MPSLVAPILVIVFSLYATEIYGTSQFWSSRSCKIPSSIDLRHIRASNMLIQCRVVSAPLFYDKEKSITTPLHVRRVIRRTPTTPKPKIAVWFIAGGPGSSSNEMIPYMIQLHQIFKGEIEVYTLDHRGVGGSNFLRCSLPDSEIVKNIRQCLQELHDTQRHPEAYTVTNAAKDLYFLIKKFNSDQIVYLVGTSYGTYLIERFLSIYPKTLIIKGAILDGVLVQAGPHSNVHDALGYQRVDEPGKLLLADCSKNPSCSSKLPHPEEQLRALYAKLEGGHCSEGLQDLYGEEITQPASQAKELLGKIFLKYDFKAIPELVYRFHRCEQQDIQYFQNYYARHQTPQMDQDPNTQNDFSSVLFFLIDFSEIYIRPTPSRQQLIDQHNEALISIPIDYLQPSYCAASGWNDTYCGDVESQPSLLNDRDEFFHQVAQVPENGGVMMLHGRYDCQTRLSGAETQFNLMTGNRKLFVFDHLRHGILRTSKIKTHEVSCGLTLIKSFIENEADLEKVDVACIDAVNRQFSFGDVKLWDQAIK